MKARAKKIKSYNWPGRKANVTEWWDGLTHDQKLAHKQHYEALCVWNKTRKYPYPDMYDTTGLKVRELSHKMIDRIANFKDHEIPTK